MDRRAASSAVSDPSVATRMFMCPSIHGRRFEGHSALSDDSQWTVSRPRPFGRMPHPDRAPCPCLHGAARWHPIPAFGGTFQVVPQRADIRERLCRMILKRDRCSDHPSVSRRARSSRVATLIVSADRCADWWRGLPGAERRYSGCCPEGRSGSPRPIRGIPRWLARTARWRFRTAGCFRCPRYPASWRDHSWL
jgi:hypothetical protein